MSVSSLDPLRDELPPGVVGEVVCREHLALDEGLQVLDLEVADLKSMVYITETRYYMYMYIS